MNAPQATAPGAFRDPPPFALETAGHALAFYPGGADRLQALLDLIDGARQSLRLAFYIYAPDSTGERVRDALVAAARRGVAVTLVLDDFGATADAEFFAPLTDAGGRFCCFQPHWNTRYLIRNHQKLAIADGALAMLGGFNIEDSYFAPPQDNGWTDLGFTIAGPVVAQLVAWFDVLDRWATNPHARLRSIRRLVRDWRVGDGPVQLLLGGPTAGPRSGLSSWTRAISHALKHGQRLDMVMAYFTPPPHLQRRIEKIAGHGSARLVMAAKSDNAATIGASRALYTKLLEAGTELWEYEASRLHTKLIVLDDTVWIGSANFDMRSLYINLEVMLCIHDAGLAQAARGLIDAYQPGSRRITLADHRRQATWWNRLRWRASWFLVSVIDYSVSRRLNLGLGAGYVR